MKIIKKYWVLIITAVLLIITACRIIYVNVTYPSGKIRYINVLNRDRVLYEIENSL